MSYTSNDNGFDRFKMRSNRYNDNLWIITKLNWLSNHWKKYGPKYEN